MIYRAIVFTGPTGADGRRIRPEPIPYDFAVVFSPPHPANANPVRNNKTHVRAAFPFVRDPLRRRPAIGAQKRGDGSARAQRCAISVIPPLTYGVVFFFSFAFFERKSNYTRRFTGWHPRGDAYAYFIRGSKFYFDRTVPLLLNDTKLIFYHRGRQFCGPSSFSPICCHGDIFSVQLPSIDVSRPPGPGRKIACDFGFYRVRLCEILVS